MITTYDLLLSTFLAPLVLSLVIAIFTLRWSWLGVWGLALVLLLSYFSIHGLPRLPPREAIDWLWIIGLATLAVAAVPVTRRWRGLWLSGWLCLCLAIIVWPARHNASIQLFAELAVVIGAGTALFMRTAFGPMAAFGALSLAVVSAGYALVAFVGGSLIVGLLSGALASTLGGFALVEIIRSKQQALLPVRATLLAGIWLLCLMVIGRIYAELPLGPLALLLVGFVWRWLLPPRGFWQAALSATIPTAGAIIWLLTTQGPKSY